MKHLYNLLLAALAVVPLQAQTTTQAWQNFAGGTADNVLLDFSYAGYNHGLSAPVEGDAQTLAKKLGYTLYNVCDYGAVPDDGKSDRAALEAVIAKIGKGKPNAKAIIYFPKGEYILHTSGDDTEKNGKTVSNTLNLVMGHVIIKGDGRGKTILTMDAPMLPTDETTLYSSPVMMSVRHNGNSQLDNKTITKVTGSASKNDMSVMVETTTGLNVGDWVRLYMKNNDDKVIKEELGGLTPLSSMTNLKAGVEVIEVHQIKSIDGNKVTFEEPVMHAVNPDYGWTINTYYHYEEVGVEDLTFKGAAKATFHHHASWQDDGAYKPLSLVRLVNSWVRRVDFVSVSECITFENCANCMCLDVEISGNRGHSAVRMANSTRGFIGKVYDHSNGYADSDTGFENLTENLGQYHACGISKHSIGNVVWQCRWGNDACFESHATQPRASLFDQCTGGFMQYRMGGDKYQLPNHLDDLTIWNFNCTACNPAEFPFQWWHVTDIYLKTMPPTVVGFHGKDVEFEESQMKLNESQGTAVLPASLYEAQLVRRLGSTPQWLADAKNITTSVKGINIGVDNQNGDGREYSLGGTPVGKDYHGIVVKRGKKLVRK